MTAPTTHHSWNTRLPGRDLLELLGHRGQNVEVLLQCARRGSSR